MPLTIIPNPNGAYLGTGLPLRWNFPDGDVQGGDLWRVIVFGEGGSSQTWLAAQRAADAGSTGQLYRPFINDPGWSTTQNIGIPVTHGAQVTAVVELERGGVIIGSTQVQGVWDATSGIPMQIQAAPAVSGGFNASDRALLTATEGRTQILGEPGSLTATNASGPLPVTLAQIFSRQTLDLLTMTELTSGPTFDPVRVDYTGGWYRAVVVRVTTIAEDLVAKTPDFSWYFPDLAVLRIFRGVDLEYRRGIHTPTFLQEKQWGWGWTFPNFDAILGAPPETTIAVDWREGCAGQVFVLRLP